MSDEETAETPPPRRPRWRRKRWWLLFLFLVTLVWIDGPGWRWLARIAADHYLPPLGIKSEFELDGRLSQGEIRFRSVDAGGSPFLSVGQLDEAVLRYRPTRVIHGEIESLSIHGLRADIDLDALPPKKPEGPEKSPSKSPAELLQQWQERLAPVEIDLREIQLTLRRGNETLVDLAPSDLVHPAGSDRYELRLGSILLPNNSRLPAQESSLVLQPDALELDRLEILPDVVASQVRARFPAPDGIQVAGSLSVFESRLAIETDLLTAKATLSGAALPVPETLEKFGIELPLEGRITSFAADLRGLDQGLQTLTGSLNLGFEEARWQEWTADDARLEFDLTESNIDARLTGSGLGSPVDLRLAGEVLRRSGFRLGKIGGSLEIAATTPALDFLRRRYLQPTELPALPRGALKAELEADFTRRWNPAASASITLVSPDDAPPLKLDVSWDGKSLASASFGAPGIDATGTFSTAARRYTGSADTRDFDPASLSPWLSPFGIRLPEGMQGSLTWTGSGDLPDARHEGKLDLTSFTLKRSSEEQPVSARAQATYDWPGNADIASLEVRHGNQTLRTRARLAEQRVDLQEILWQDGELKLLEGQASLPMPAKFSDWKAILRSSAPIAAEFSGKDLPLARLHPFLPESFRFPDASRAQLSVELRGTPSDPTLDLTLRGNSISLTTQPAVPPIDLDLRATGRGRSLKIEGGVTAPDYPPAVIDALTVWDPRQWAEDPETVRQAALDATVVIEKFQIGLFSRFLPEARKLAGEINLRGEVTGTIGDPKPLVTLTVDGAAFETPDPSVPRLKDGKVRLQATPASIQLTDLSGMLSGGPFQAQGSAKLDQGTLKDLDLTLTGDALPIARNESLVARASTKLRIQGDMEKANIVGSVTMVDSVFYRDFEILPIGAPINNVAEPQLPSVDSDTPAENLSRLPAPFRDWTLDLTLKTENPFLIRGNLGNGEIYLDARVGGTLGSPRPIGAATLREITAQLPFSTLEIPTGRVVFRPDAPFDPALEIRGRSNIRPYEVDLYIYGSASDPRIQTTSNPPLPESEVLTLLATGATSEGVEDTSAASARAAQLLIEEVRRGRIELARGLRPLLQVLDKVEFQVGERDPYSNRKFNSASFQLSDEWLLTAGFSEEGRTRAKVTYLIRFR
ncbi:MAG: translocation/assembly module TamB [Akkermansiaceae bacterium]|jgi:hypothetical protein|nr:translocation/assembly module TamB [Akkermansiaceae bacterium]